MTVQKTLSNIIRTLEQAGNINPVLDAEVLLAYALGIERYKLLSDGKRHLTESEYGTIKSLVDRRMTGEPVAYITGSKEFYSLDFTVSPDVLIPRPETEFLVDLAIYHARKDGVVLDVGTGSGAIAVSLKHNRPDLTVYATDISEAAISVARKNCETILKSMDSVIFRTGDLFGPVSDIKFDIIVSNPPYISPSLKGKLERDISFEPDLALYAGNNGLSVIEALVMQVTEYLNTDGIVFIEIAPEHSGFVCDMGTDLNMEVSIMNDYSGTPRIASLKKITKHVV